MAIVNIDTTVYKLVQTPGENVFTLTGGTLKAIAAANVSIEDVGNYYIRKNVEGALQEVGTDLGAIESDITALDGRITTAEGDITALDGRVTTAEGDITALDGRVTTAEGDITALELQFTNLTASQVAIADAGGYYTSSQVEGALQEVGFNANALTVQVNSMQITLTSVGEATTENIYSILDIQAILNAYPTSFTSNQFISPIQTLSISAGLIAWNMANGQRAKVTLTSSATLSNPTSKAAAFPDLEVRQDGTGGRVLSFGTDFVFSTTYAAAPTTANSYTLYHFQLRSDGKIAVNYIHFAA